MPDLFPSLQRSVSLTSAIAAVADRVVTEGREPTADELADIADKKMALDVVYNEMAVSCMTKEPIKIDLD